MVFARKRNTIGGTVTMMARSMALTVQRQGLYRRSALFKRGVMHAGGASSACSQLLLAVDRCRCSGSGTAALTTLPISASNCVISHYTSSASGCLTGALL